MWKATRVGRCAAGQAKAWALSYVLLLAFLLSAPTGHALAQTESKRGGFRRFDLESARSGDTLSPHSTEAISLDAQLGFGFESNVFEINQRFENPVADEFSNGSFDFSVPLKSVAEDLVFDLSGTWKKYFHERQIDEYAFKPELSLEDIAVGPAKLTLSIDTGLVRERIYNQFGDVPERSEPGVGGGGGWTLEADLSHESTFTWTGEVEAKTFFKVPQDNIRISSEAEVAVPLVPSLYLHGGTEWELQCYRVRPFDAEADLNPRSLGTIEGRGFLSLESKPSRGWAWELALNAGPNIDITNGYYNAAVLGGRVDIARRLEAWTFRVSAEPEWVWFSHRPANLSQPAEKLFTQEYVFECGVEYACTKFLKIFGAEIVHLQYSSSHEVQPDAVLNSFIDIRFEGGVSFSY